jgi:hypothetical protein
MYDFTTGKPPASRLFYQLGERLHSELLLILCRQALAPARADGRQTPGAWTSKASYSKA